MAESEILSALDDITEKLSKLVELAKREPECVDLSQIEDRLGKIFYLLRGIDLTLEYDASGNLTKVTYELGKVKITKVLTYDSNGNLIRVNVTREER